MTEETIYMYIVDYYCPDEDNRLFKLNKKKDLERFGTKLTRKDFYEDGGYGDSFLFSELHIKEKDACNFAKKQSKKTKDLANVKACWCSKNEWGEFEIDDMNENYLRQFNVGKEV